MCTTPRREFLDFFNIIGLFETLKARCLPRCLRILPAPPSGGAPVAYRCEFAAGRAIWEAGSFLCAVPRSEFLDFFNITGLFETLKTRCLPRCPRISPARPDGGAPVAYRCEFAAGRVIWEAREFLCAVPRREFLDFFNTN